LRNWVIPCRRAGAGFLMGTALPRKRNTSRPVLPGPGGTAYLTARQVEVLELAAHGLSNKQIAVHLGLSARTVEDRFAEMRKRTGASTKYELIAWGVAAGTVAPGPLPSQRPGRLASRKDALRPPMSTSGQAWPGEVERDETLLAIPRVRDRTEQDSSLCKVCQTPVIIAATGRPRAYCSPACRARAYRARQQAASRNSSVHGFYRDG
jgi:DNA-binding CsgD family transcriptional regulator